MEPWRHTSAGMSPFLCDEIGFPARDVSMGGTMKPFCDSYGTIGSSREVIQSVEYKEKEILNIMGKSDSSNPRLDVLDGEIGSCVSRTLPSSACDIKSNSPFGESESGSSFSSPFSASSGSKSSLVDLNLGKLVDWREAKNSRSVDGTTVFSSLGSLYASKRARTMNLPSQSPTCQVQGCNDDLSSSKDYHKRHRVCDVHSKTARVIVKGIEQRFCQQCSRFHLLAEFDDGKRSCRKRLAGHNERRRKPQLDTMSGNPHTLLQYFEDYRFPRTPQPKGSSFVFPGMLPSGLITSQGSNQYSYVKQEESSNSKLLFHLNGLRKQFSSGKISTLETASAVQELPGVSNSSSALSLLSKNLSSHLTEIPLVMDHNAGNYDGVRIENSFSSYGFRSSVMNSMEIGQVGPQVFCDGGSSAAVDFQVPASGIFQRSDCVKGKGFISPEHGPTVDLFQLSSHLQRVEQQRNSMQLKQENDVFCYFPPISGL